MAARRVLIVGASLAGVSVAQELRDRDRSAEIVIVGEELQPPYDRPPLSKQMLTAVPSGLVVPELRPRAWYEDNRIELRLGRRVRSLHPNRLELDVDDGTRLGGDEIVLATGARARRVVGWPALAGVYYLRTWGDSVQLSESLSRPGRLVVVGGGFIGLEVASAAVARGWHVTVVEAADAPLCRVLPRRVAQMCTRGLVSAGVEFRCGESVSGIEGRRGHVSGVRLAAGDLLVADSVVVGIGALPNTEWLAGSGVELADGVVCDGLGRTSRAGVWAVGDVARWPNGVTGRQDRVEQWQAARDQARTVAEALTGGQQAWATAPYFWSDLRSQKLQFVGWAHREHECHVVEIGHRVVCVIGDEWLRAVLTISSPRHLAFGRRLLVNGAAFTDARRWVDELGTQEIAS
jgi:3-phenylpropionate/trans-cinnamate dioxygenase ferredoxin reductase subunit